jgi:hypothetical protein
LLTNKKRKKPLDYEGLFYCYVNRSGSNPLELDRGIGAGCKMYRSRA